MFQSILNNIRVFMRLLLVGILSVSVLSFAAPAMADDDDDDERSARKKTRIQAQLRGLRNQVRILRAEVDALNSRVGELETTQGPLLVFDSVGTRVGQLYGGDQFFDVRASATYSAILEHEGAFFVVPLKRDGYQKGLGLVWESTDCTGTPFIQLNIAPTPVPLPGDTRAPLLPTVTVSGLGNTLYSGEGTPELFQIGSRGDASDGSCVGPLINQFAIALFATPVVALDSLFVPPFSVGR